MKQPPDEVWLLTWKWHQSMANNLNVHRFYGDSVRAHKFRDALLQDSNAWDIVLYVVSTIGRWQEED